MRFTQSQVDAHQARMNAKSERIDELSPEREAGLHEQIFSECRRRGWIALHGSMSERTSRTAGEPDFVIMANDGRVFFIECKSRTGKLSTAQQALKHAASALGHEIHVVRSFDHFLEVVK